MIDWILDRLPFIALLAFLLVIGWAVVMLVDYSTREKAEFMADCQQHHAKYECTVMWRTGRQSAVPVPIIVPR